MNTFNWTRALGFGALLWMIMFVITSGLVGFGASMVSVWWSIIIAVIAGITSFILASYTEINSATRAFEYGAIWLVIGIALDLLISRQFNTSIFASWQYWLGYALVLVAPWLRLEISSASRQVTV